MLQEAEVQRPAHFNDDVDYDELVYLSDDSSSEDHFLTSSVTILNCLQRHKFLNCIISP